MGQVNWDSLNTFLFDLKKIPFSWGDHDCATTAAAILYRATGVDYLASLRGLWTDRESALAVIASYGSLEQAVDSLTEFSKIQISEAGLLDLVIVKVKGTEALGVNLGKVAVVATTNGLSLVPWKYVTTCWRTNS